MADSSPLGRRRSTRRRSSPVRNLEARTSDQSSSESEAGSESGDDNFRAPAKRGKAGTPGKRAAKRVKRGKRAAAPLEAEDEAEEDPNRVENFLYEAVLDPEASLETLVTDFLESYAEDANQSLTDLVNFVLRCCGTKQEITSYDVEDADTIPETLTQLQDHLTGKDHDVIKTTTDTYPLISKHKDLKTFRRQMADFWRILVDHSADKQYLYDDEAGKLWVTIEAWLVSMSSSALRSFRHTSTNICLTIMTALVELSVKLAKDLEIANKQLAAEEKKTKKTASKIKTIQKTIESKTGQSDKLTETTANYFDEVFVHRYRDVDARIRGECVKELGIWMMKLPHVFFEGQYLRYLGWVLSDTSGGTRLEVIKALTKLYAFDEYAGGMRHFTERFKTRIVEIATEDAETNIRCAALNLVDKVRERGYLEDEDTEAILACLFDDDAKVRAATTATFHSVLADRENEIIDELLSGNVEDHGELKSSWTNLKALVSTLNSISTTIEKIEAEESGSINLAKEQDVLCPGRIRIAAETFLHGLHGVDFDHISDYLLYDNDASDEPASTDAKDVLKSVLALSVKEEQMLLEVLVASAELARTTAEGKRTKKEEEDLSTSQSIMDHLPRLLARFNEPKKLTILLQLISVCDLGIYAKLRRTSLLESLLDTLVELFFGYKDDGLSRAIGACLLQLSQEESLSSLVKDKFLDLQDSIRDAFLGDISSDEECLSVLKRLEVVSSVDDCVLSFEDEKTDDKLSIFDKLKSLLDKENEAIASLARCIVRNYFLWKLKQLTETRFGLERKDVDEVVARRDDVLSILDAQVEAGNRSAALVATELESMFTCLYELEHFGDGLAVRRPLDVNLQSLITRALQKEMKRFAKMQHKLTLKYQGDVSSSSSSSDDDDDAGSDNDGGGAGGGGEGAVSESLLARRRVKSLLSERKICAVTGEIVAAVAARKMDAAVLELLLANKGKLGHSYDAILREIPADFMAASRRKQDGAGRGKRAINNNNDDKNNNKKGQGRRPVAKTPEVLMAESGDEIET